MDSLHKRIPVLLILALLPVLLFTAFTLWQSGRQMQNEVISTNESALDFYVAELEQSLEHMQSYLLNFSVFNTDVSNIKNDQHDVRMIVKSKVFEKMRQDFSMYDADCLFVYTPRYDELVTVYSSNITYLEISNFREQLLMYSDEYVTSFHWSVGRIGGMPLLYQINYSNVGGYLYGALYDVEVLQNRLEESSNNNMGVYLTGKSALPLTATNAELLLSDQPYTSSGQTVIQQCSEKGFILWQVFSMPVFLGNGNVFLSLCC